jgi:uncharacterized protein YqjF (DUF2071 family)
VAQDADSMLRQTDHRPFPLPASPWVLAQSWNDVLFAHWPMDAALVRSLVPEPLEIDVFDDTAWVGVSPFEMTDVHPRLTPAMPFVSQFAELNVRTYVTLDGIPGIWFVSLDCASLVAIALARTAYHLPYHLAQMSIVRAGGSISFRSHRTISYERAANLAVTYAPRGEPYIAAKDSFERWAIERYCLYSQATDETLWRTAIHHRPWTIQPARAEFDENTVMNGTGIALPLVPSRLHFAARQDVLTWLPVQVRGSNA